MRRVPILMLFVALCAAPLVNAQTNPPLPTLRSTSEPEELLSMSGDTPFLKAMQIFAASFKRFASKPLVYEEVLTVPAGAKSIESRTIGINIPNMHWHDAFDLALRVNGFWYLENPDYVKVVPIGGSAKDSAATNPATAMSTREVEIAAIFFEANRTQMEQLGINWSLTNTAGSAKFYNDVQNVDVVDRTLVTAASGSSGSSGSGSSGSGSSGSSSSNSGSSSDFGLFSKISATYKAIDILGKLKALQSENLGELISSPSITVRSGEVGRIHVGQDFSVKQRDFSGNTTEKFYSAGTIIDVTPSIMMKDSLEFVHLKIAAERSSVFPDPVSTIVNKTLANTSVLLIDGEETVVGGLFTNDVQKVRRGVPFLKDLPWWVLGLRYLFGYDEDQMTKKELIIILKASIVPSIESRMARKLVEIKSGQKTLQLEAERVDAYRDNLLRQIEASHSKRK